MKFYKCTLYLTSSAGIARKFAGESCSHLLNFLLTFHDRDACGGGYTLPVIAANFLALQNLVITATAHVYNYAS